MLRGRNIVCLSTHYWNDPWFRKQHFMSRFAKNGNRILYVEPTFSMIRRPYKDTAKNRPFRSFLQRMDKNIFLLKPPQALPKCTEPLISKMNHIWFAKIIDRAARRLSMNHYILWVYRPEYFPALKYFSYEKLGFGLTDDLAAYGGKKDNAYYYKNRCINGLIDESNVVIVTAQTLLEKYQSKTSGKIFCVPNGVDLKLFWEASRQTPADLRNMKRPIIGFVGVLFKFIDYDLITYVADKNKDCSVALVGPIEPWGTKEAIEKLTKRKNIYLLGKKKREEIPSYIAQFDVCINPFKVDQVSRSANPLKIYEYLACGKPIVSTDMESLKLDKLISSEIDFAADYFAFDKLVKQGTTREVSKEERMRKIQVVGNYSWDKLFHELLTIMQEHGFCI